MRIGFTTIYAWRPHVEHLQWLSDLSRQAGHTVSYLVCDADLAACYTKLLRPQRFDWMHCARCRAGGVRSYAVERVASIGALVSVPTPPSPEAAEWSMSSASTLGRFESDAEFSSAKFREIADRLDEPTRRAHAAASRWIERERLDAICLFNGRMDATRGVLEAARAAGIPFVSLERTWFGDGLQLLPQENCLGLRSIDRMMTEWRDLPLTRAQALRAIAPVATRFLRRNVKEWRAYNLTARDTEWPVAGATRRILLVPGSRNEMWGHPDWRSGWGEPTSGYDALIDHLGLQAADLVLRCHPNWGERIGVVDGQRSERYFTDWAQRRGIRVITSTDPTSTLGLIERADAIVVAGGSAALEAGILGKQVIALAPSLYQHAGIQDTAYDASQLTALRLLADAPAGAAAVRSQAVARATLRFAHTIAYRVSQYARHVLCETTTRYRYLPGADPQRWHQLLRTGVLQPDDGESAADDSEESAVLRAVAGGEWEALGQSAEAAAPVPAWISTPVQRRWMFRPIDRIREALPRGDL